MRHVLLQLLAAFLALALPAGSAHAYSYWHCDGRPVAWTSPAHFQVMRCSIPEGSQRAADVIYGFDEWNSVEGMYDVFAWEWGPTECVGIEHGDDRNQVYFGVPAEMDGAVGVTAVRMSSCDSDIIEADVAFDAAQMNEWGSPPCNTYNPFGSRTTVVHEFGHALGLDHDDRFMNLMMTSDGEGKYCGNFVIEPHPDDVAGGRFLYNSGRRSVDIGTSAHWLVGLNDVALSPPTATTAVCPGELHVFRWSVGNLGTEGTTYDVAFVLSFDQVISTSDIWLDGNVGAFEPVGAFTTWVQTSRIPTSVAWGTDYNVGVILDWADLVPERRWSNNATALAGKVHIKTPTECR